MKTLILALGALALGLTIVTCGGSGECTGAQCAGATTSSSSTTTTSSSSGGGSSSSSTTTTSSSSSSGSGGGGGSTCMLDVPPPGPTFTFHVHNGSPGPWRLVLGCGNDVPIALDTPSGTVAVSFGSGWDCDADGTCESAYKGKVITMCSDCGPGVGKDLPLGGTVDIVWDHRGYVGSTAPEACSGVAGGQPCKLAVPVATTMMQKGTLTLCGVGGFMAGYCPVGQDFKVNFTVDTTQSEAVIEVM